MPRDRHSCTVRTTGTERQKGPTNATYFERLWDVYQRYRRFVSHILKNALRYLVDWHRVILNKMFGDLSLKHQSRSLRRCTLIYGTLVFTLRFAFFLFPFFQTQSSCLSSRPNAERPNLIPTQRTAQLHPWSSKWCTITSKHAITQVMKKGQKSIYRTRCNDIPVRDVHG